MAMDFNLPDLGEGIHEAQVVNVLVKQGDTVREDQIVMEVETDKAAVELPVPFSGMISRLHVKAGDTVRVGTALLSVEAAEAAEAPVPREGLSARQAAVPSAERKARAAAREEEAAPEKAEPVESAASLGPAPGSVRDGDGRRRRSQEASIESVGAAPVAIAEGPVPAAPAVRRLAREMQIDLRRVRGTGPGGRILKEDVERLALSGAGRAAAPSRPATEAGPAREETAPAAPPLPAPGAEPLPDFSQYGRVRREKVAQIRKTIARQMSRAHALIPSVTHGDEADVTDLDAFRQEHGQIFADKGVKITLTAFVLKAIIGGLQQFPQLNASYDESTSEMIYKEYYHIGVAVDTSRGLIVPVLRDVDRKSLMVISREMKDMAERAREFKVDLAELRGGTFTVTNVGALGGTFSTPMINYPEVAILGMGKLDWRPVIREGQVVPRKMLPLFLSFDHRVIDGADAARFVRTVISLLENPLNLLLVS